jgi:hypothetical protein
LCGWLLAVGCWLLALRETEPIVKAKRPNRQKPIANSTNLFKENSIFATE